jgi:glyoxylase-like metal-dependent hydrolase (beta-lactamase superfamily II)
MQSHHSQPATSPVAIADGTTLIDLQFQDTPGVIGAFLLVGEDELALVETGPTTTRATLEQGIRAAGFEPGDVTRLIVTHIHLGHAGAAGSLMRDYPAMRLTVHANGAPHMIDPERLLKSATRIYGDRMDELWGEVVGIDPERVDPIGDGDTIVVAGRPLLVRDAPGHASTQVVLLDQSTGMLFTGDAAGARVTGTRYVCPTLAPPELDFASWAETIRTMRELRPAALALTHFGAFADADRHLADVLPGIDGQERLARAVLRSEADVDTFTERLLEMERTIYADEGVDVDAAMASLQYAMPAWLASLGLLRVLKKAGLLAS